MDCAMYGETTQLNFMMSQNLALSHSLIGMQQPLKCLVSIFLPDDEVSFEFGCTT